MNTLLTDLRTTKHMLSCIYNIDVVNIIVSEIDSNQ